MPPLEPDQVLVAVMAAGINFNNVWAARGLPIDIIRVRQRAGEPWDFHIGGSDASGIVYAVGDAVSDVSVGDEVVIHHGWWDADDPWVAAGNDPMLAPSARIWGYETNFGSFGQFAVAQAHQCLPKAPQLSWEEAAAATLVGATAYRMLHGWPPNTLRAGEPVLVWGGSGGLGTQATQLAVAAGARPVAVVSDHHWVRQKRLQGSHGTNDEQARAYNELVVSGVVDPCLGKLHRFDEIPDAHDEMERGVDVFGNRVALVGAPEPRLGRQ